jgi:hypothetical protein
MRLDAAPERAFGGNAHRIGGDPEGGQAQPVEVRLPRRAIGVLAMPAF